MISGAIRCCNGADVSELLDEFQRSTINCDVEVGRLEKLATAVAFG